MTVYRCVKVTLIHNRQAFTSEKKPKQMYIGLTTVIILVFYYEVLFYFFIKPNQTKNYVESNNVSLKKWRYLFVRVERTLQHVKSLWEIVLLYLIELNMWYTSSYFTPSYLAKKHENVSKQRHGCKMSTAIFIKVQSWETQMPITREKYKQIMAVTLQNPLSNKKGPGIPKAATCMNLRDTTLSWMKEVARKKGRPGTMQYTHLRWDRRLVYTDPSLSTGRDNMAIQRMRVVRERLSWCKRNTSQTWASDQRAHREQPAQSVYIRSLLEYVRS